MKSARTATKFTCPETLCGCSGLPKALSKTSRTAAAQGHYAEAEPPYNRALAIWEKALGPGHPNMALGLENYAVLLEETGRGDAAKLMKLRAKAIRAKHAQENPVE